MRSFLLTISTLACLAAWPAQACKILPPGTPAEETRRAIERQTDLADRATTIFLAEVVDTGVVQVRGSPFPGRQVTLRPFYALEGPAPRRLLTLRHDGYDTCGLSPQWGVLLDEPGSTWVIFATAAEPGQAAVLGAIRLDQLAHPRLQALLAPRSPRALDSEHPARR